MTFDQFAKLALSRCVYCLERPSQLTGKKRANGKDGYFHVPVRLNGIDRRDNTKGYTVENSVPCCKPCNTAKGNRTYEQFYNRQFYRTVDQLVKALDMAMIHRDH